MANVQRPTQESPDERVARLAQQLAELAWTSIHTLPGNMMLSPDEEIPVRCSVQDVPIEYRFLDDFSDD